MSDSTYNTMRLWTIVGLCLLRLAVTRCHLQAYLGLAERWVEQMRREAGRITGLEIQRKVGMRELGWEPGGLCAGPADPHHLQITRIYCYVAVVSLQYLGPVVLTLHCTLLLKTLGEEVAGGTWGLGRGRMGPAGHCQAIGIQSVPRFLGHD